MNTDRALAWVGVTIGALGLIPIFRDANIQLRLAYCLVLLPLLVLFAVLYRSGRGPQYSTVSMRKTLTLKTQDGSLAELVREQKIKVNYGSMAEVWCRKIVADGSITNIRVDKDPPSDEDQEWLDCLLDVRKKFLRNLYRGDEECVTWSYDLKFLPYREGVYRPRCDACNKEPGVECGTTH